VDGTDHERWKIEPPKFPFIDGFVKSAELQSVIFRDANHPRFAFAEPIANRNGYLLSPGESKTPSLPECLFTKKKDH